MLALGVGDGEEGDLDAAEAVAELAHVEELVAALGLDISQELGVSVRDGVTELPRLYALFEVILKPQRLQSKPYLVLLE